MNVADPDKSECRARTRVPLVLCSMGLTAMLLNAAGACVGSSPDDAQQADDTGPGLERVGRLGCSDCGVEETLTPTALAILDDQRVAVLDRFEPFVRIFTLDGELDAAFGNKGEGPGELGTGDSAMYLPGLYLFPQPDGGVGVLSPLQPVIDRFDAAGNFVEVIDTGPLGSLPHAQTYSSEARIYYRHSTPFPPGPDSIDQIDRCPLQVDNPRTCDTFDLPADFLERLSPSAAGGRLRPALAAGPSGELVAVDAGTYSIWIFEPDGTLRTQTRREVERVRKTEAEIALEQQANEGLSVDRRRPIDEYRPHIELLGVQVDGRGRIWALTERYQPDTSVFDVLDDRGELVTTVEVTGAIRTGRWHITPILIRDDVLAAIVTLPDGNYAVDVYRIVGNG